MQGTHSYNLCASIGLAIERILHPTDDVFANTLQRSTRLQLGTRDEDGLDLLANLLRSYKALSDAWGYDADGHAHTRYEDKMHAVHALYGCTYPISDVLFRNLARAAAETQCILYNLPLCDTLAPRVALSLTRPPAGQGCHRAAYWSHLR